MGKSSIRRGRKSRQKRGGEEGRGQMMATDVRRGARGSRGAAARQLWGGTRCVVDCGLDVLAPNVAPHYDVGETGEYPVVWDRCCEGCRGDSGSAPGSAAGTLSNGGNPGESGRQSTPAQSSTLHSSSISRRWGE